MEDYGTVVKLLSGWVIYLTVQSAYKGVGTIYVRREFRLRIPRAEHDLADLEVPEAGKKNCERQLNEFNSSIH